MKSKRPVTWACPRWCDYIDARNHPDMHIVHIGDIIPATRGRVTVLAVTVESADNGSPAPVLGTLTDSNGDACTAQLTWTESERLARLLHDAKRRYA